MGKLSRRIVRSTGHGRCQKGHPLPRGLPVLQLAVGRSRVRHCASCAMELAHYILEKVAAALDDRHQGDEWVPCPGCGNPGQPFDDPRFPFVCPTGRALCAVELFDRSGNTSNSTRTLHKGLNPEQYAHGGDGSQP